MFDYKGFSKEVLVNICNPNNAYRGLHKHVYWCSEAYSIGHCLRSYANYPSWMSLYVYASHGGVNRNAGFPHEVENDAKAMLVYNEEARRNYRLKSDKPCYLVTMPYVWYRKQRGYHKRDDALGTLAYPHHSTDQLESHFDVLKYIEELKALPRDFHPVCACLFAADINKGLHNIFIDNGIPVYSAGHWEDIAFVDRFYSILQNFKFTTSNFTGSYTVYSVEMGIPFSFYGDTGFTINKSDGSLGDAEIIDYYNTEKFLGVDFARYLREDRALFSGLNTKITSQQKEHVDFTLGIGQNGLSRKELHDLLWECARANKFRMTKNAVKVLAKKTRYLLKPPRDYWPTDQV